MPELPEVETICRDLSGAITGARILSVEVNDPRIVRGSSPVAFSAALTGRTIRGVMRRGKAVVISLGGECLVVQLMMTGQLITSAENKAAFLKETLAPN